MRTIEEVVTELREMTEPSSESHYNADVRYCKRLLDEILEISKTNESVKGDLISRSEVIKTIWNLFNNWGNNAVRFSEDETRLINTAFQMVQRDIEKLPTAYNDGWIPVSSGKLPEDCDNRFYMCIVENHEEDLPMFCQYDEDYGFGFWQDIYDEHTLGFVDSEFKTNEELGYEKVIAWQPVPPYQPKGE